MDGPVDVAFVMGKRRKGSMVLPVLVSELINLCLKFSSTTLNTMHDCRDRFQVQWIVLP